MTNITCFIDESFIRYNCERLHRTAFFTLTERVFAGKPSTAKGTKQDIIMNPCFVLLEMIIILNYLWWWCVSQHFYSVILDILALSTEFILVLPLISAFSGIHNVISVKYVYKSVPNASSVFEWLCRWSVRKELPMFHSSF